MNKGFERYIKTFGDNIPIDRSFISECAYRRKDMVLGRPTL